MSKIKTTQIQCQDPRLEPSPSSFHHPPPPHNLCNGHLRPHPFENFLQSSISWHLGQGCKLSPSLPLRRQASIRDLSNCQLSTRPPNSWRRGSVNWKCLGGWRSATRTWLRCSDLLQLLANPRHPSQSLRDPQTIRSYHHKGITTSRCGH